MPSAAFLLVSDERTLALAPGSYVIGRGTEADIFFERDPKLSRRHARLVVDEAGVDVEDLGSTNGTWVNSYLVQHRLRVTGPTRLKIGDVELRLLPVRDRAASELRTTAPESPLVKAATAHDDEDDRDITTEQAAAFSYARSALMDLIGNGNVAQAKRTLDPLLAQVELATSAPEKEAIDVASELALRLALAACEAHYADAAVRIHCAHGAVASDATLELLATCMASGLEPDMRNLDAYLAALGEDDRQRVTRALSTTGVTVPAPAPDDTRR